MSEYYSNLPDDDDGGWDSEEFDDDDEDDINGCQNGNMQADGYPQEVYEVVDNGPNMNQCPPGGFRPPPARPGTKTQNVKNEVDRFHSPRSQNFPPSNASSHQKPIAQVAKSFDAGSSANRQQKPFAAGRGRTAQNLPPVPHHVSSSDEDYEIADEDTLPEKKLSGSQFFDQLQQIQRKNTIEKNQSYVQEPVNETDNSDDVYEVCDAASVPMDIPSSKPRNAMPCPPSSNRTYPSQTQTSPPQNKNLKTNIQSSNMFNGQSAPFASHRLKPTTSEPRTMQSNFSNVKQNTPAANIPTSQHSRVPPNTPAVNIPMSQRSRVPLNAPPVNIPTSQHSRIPLNTPTVSQSFPPPPDEVTEDDFYEPIENGPDVQEKLASGPLPGSRHNQGMFENNRPNLPAKCDKPGNVTSQADIVSSLAKQMNLSKSPHTAPHIQGRQPHPIPRTEDTANSPNKWLPSSTPKGPQGSPGVTRKNPQVSPGSQHRPIPAQRTDMGGGPINKRPPSIFPAAKTDFLAGKENRPNSGILTESKQGAVEQSQSRILPHSSSQEKVFPVGYAAGKMEGFSSNTKGALLPPSKKVSVPALPFKPATNFPLTKPASTFPKPPFEQPKITPSFLIQDSKEKSTFPKFIPPPSVIPKQEDADSQNHGGSRCVAIKDHPSDGGDCLLFHKGDIILLTETTHDYWWFGSLNGKNGRFPKSCVEVKTEDEIESKVGNPLTQASWYGGKMDRRSAEFKLRSRNQNGCFYIRDTDKGDGYSMSLIHDGAITHLRVPFKDGGYYLGASGLERFDSVIDLVEHYTSKELVLKTGVKTFLIG